MLTLKVISTDRNGQKSTFLISGTKISYNTTRGHPKDVYHFSDSSSILGVIPNESEGDHSDFIYYAVRITNPEGINIEDLMIFPCSECFIMEEGKTVDVFISKYIEE